MYILGFQFFKHGFQLQREQALFGKVHTEAADAMINTTGSYSEPSFNQSHTSNVTRTLCGKRPSLSDTKINPHLEGMAVSKFFSQAFWSKYIDMLVAF